MTAVEPDLFAIGAPGSFRLGQPMRLVLEPLPGDRGLVGFAFTADDTAAGTADAPA